MENTIHLVKLSVGTESVTDLARWQQTVRGQDTLSRHITRMWPRREQELLAGGSIYWVIRGVILCRQRLLRFEEVTREDGVRRCALMLDPHLIRTEAMPRRPFQGWRYLALQDAPRDLPEARQQEEALPPGLSAALAEIGVL